jgi:hypothetical protein
MHSVPFTTKVESSNPTQARHVRYNAMWQSLSVTLGTPVSLTNKTDRHEITEILFKVPLVSCQARLFDYLSTCLLMSNRNNCLKKNPFHGRIEIYSYK